MKRRKTYRRVRDKATGQSVLLHRMFAAEMLGRPLLPGEIVHHRDGNSTNNARENLLVLPSQRYHAHVEYHLRCEKRGMPSLFPELFSGVKEERPGTLFEGVLPHQEGASRPAQREHRQRAHSPLRNNPRHCSWSTRKEETFLTSAFKMTAMPYTTLSEQMKSLSNPQRSDAFVKQLREAVRNGEFEAAQLTERVTLPKTFRKRGSDETATRETRELVIELTPEYEAWFERVNGELAATPARSAKVKPSMEAIESGQMDFKTLAEETRRKMQSSFEKGQTLGKSRAQSRSTSKAKPTRGRTAKTKK